MMIKILVCLSMIFLVSTTPAQQNREEKLQQLKKRGDIKVTEVEKDLLKIEYPNGKVLIKNIADYKPQANKYPLIYSPTYDSTIIDLRYIDTTLYHHKYQYWQEVPIHNWDFDCLRIGDVNNNGKVELYGSRKYFWTGFEPVTIYEFNNYSNFSFKYQYDSVLITRTINDMNKDGQEEILLTKTPYYSPPGNEQRFFSKPTDTSFATQLNFILTYKGGAQMNDISLGDFDDDAYTDLLFANSGWPDVHIFEYNPAINNFDSVYRFDVSEPPPWGVSGFSISDFDLDNKVDMVFGTMRGNVFVLENISDSQYINSWQGSIESYHAYIHTWSKDIDRNGKPEFWVLGDAYYNGIGTTRITIFETNGDNSYQEVGRVDLVGVFSFYAGTMQAIDIDNDGIQEMAVCIDQNFLILKFNGSRNHHLYKVYYIKQNELAATGENSVYFGATVYDLENNKNINLLISMDLINQQGTTGRRFTQIYRPDSLSSITNGSLNLPESLILKQNYPNPFNPTTIISFELIDYSNVSLKVYNILGKEIRTLLEKELPPGNYTISWEARDSNGELLPSGVYLIQLHSGNYTKTIKALLMR